MEPTFACCRACISYTTKHIDASRCKKTTIQRQIDAADRQIDQLVYQLYGLTDDEIRIVEVATTT